LFFWRRAQTRSPNSIAIEMASIVESAGSLPTKSRGISAAPAKGRSRSKEPMTLNKKEFKDGTSKITQQDRGGLVQKILPLLLLGLGHCLLLLRLL
jgi:hypothetical protein